jgi:ribosome-binding protein aMBF1 (putative translation factor)
MKTYKYLEKELAKMVKSARLSSKLSQKELAEKAHTKQEGISRCEKNGFSVYMAEKCLNAMGYKIGFNHITVGNKQGKQVYFLGGL